MRAILTWHSIDASGSVISVTPAAFRAQLETITRLGLRVVGVPELLALPDDAHAVALTFDDGFHNFRTDAWPLLRSHGFPATLFVVSDHVGRDNRWRGRADRDIPVLPLLDWDDLAALHREGLTLGAHTRTHAHLPALDAAALEDELASAADAIARRTGASVRGFAYPYGDVDARVAARTATHFDWACTTEYALLRGATPRALVPRLDAWYFREARRLAGWGTPAFRASIWLRRQARMVRASLRTRGAA